MCSFIFCRTQEPLDAALVARANHLSQRRGPDFTGVRQATDHLGAHLLFVHNLLDISGHAVTQPLVDHSTGDDTVLLFNGEIYDYDRAHYRSDSESLIPSFRRTDGDLSSSIHGEYAVVIHERGTNALNVYTDPFLTKPVYFGFKTNEPDFGVATYPSSLNALGFDRIEMAEPNSRHSVHFSKDGCQRSRADGMTFDLAQVHDTFDLWVEAFVTAVEHRVRQGVHRPFVCLSSGYDSGAVCLALNLLGVDYETFSIEAGESARVLNERIAINTSRTCRRAHVHKGLTSAVASRMADDIRDHAEPFVYVHEDGPGVRLALHQDDGALGVNFLAGLAAAAGLKVGISGAGADEIYSDYGIRGEKVYYHSEFGGVFPEDLTGLFPWKKFYGDTQRSYLFKDEFIFGRHGIEGRYPFLDAGVVQTFLSLGADLKNLEYKSPIAHFLRTHNYPFEPATKRGFAPVSPSLFGRVRRSAMTLFGN